MYLKLNPTAPPPPSPKHKLCFAHTPHPPGCMHAHHHHPLAPPSDVCVCGPLLHICAMHICVCVCAAPSTHPPIHPPHHMLGMCTVCMGRDLGRAPTHAHPTLCNLVHGHWGPIGVPHMLPCLGHQIGSRWGFLDHATCPRYTVRARGSLRTGQRHGNPTLYNLGQAHWAPLGVPHIYACLGPSLGPIQDGFGPNYPPCDFAGKSDPRP